MLRKPPEDGPPWTGNDRYEGYCVELAKKICTEYLNAPYTIKLVADGKYGEKMGDGVWNGMIGELTRRVSVCTFHIVQHDRCRHSVIHDIDPCMGFCAKSVTARNI
jgi:Ligated ion channel L-glutamate- and glycine-binding site